MEPHATLASYRCPYCESGQKERYFNHWDELRPTSDKAKRPIHQQARKLDRRFMKERFLNSYITALRLAGARVLESKMFGSYQGDWLALCFYNGEFIWVHGTFGSCSACDSFEAEFGDTYDTDSPEYLDKVAAFGRTYLESPEDESRMIARWQEQTEWDMDAADMIDFINENSINVPDKATLVKRYLAKFTKDMED